MNQKRERINIHFCTSKNCKATLRASEYLALIAPGESGTEGTESELWLFFRTVNQIATPITANTMSTMNHPTNPLDFLRSPIESALLRPKNSSDLQDLKTPVGKI